MQDAEAGRVSFLRLSAYPAIERGDISLSDISIDLYVRGYIETLGWNTWQLQTGGAKASPTSILEHIRDNNEFINSIIIEGSPDDVFCPDPFLVTQEQAVASMMQQLGDTWQIGMKAGRQLVLEPISFSPRYYMRDGLLYTDSTSAIIGAETVNPRFTRPAVVRDLDGNLTGVEPDSAYEDRRDFLMATVEVNAEDVTYSAGSIG